MHRLLGSLCLLVMAVPLAWGGEVHTRSTTGAWGTDPSSGLMRASIPNDTGYSFWLLGDSISTAAPTAVIAQIRFLNHVDYGGAGVALIDPRASTSAQPNVRIELSEREDTVGVGGWLGNENHFTGGSKKAGKDIRLNEWYELAIKVDGIRVTGFLDGTQIFSGDVPELRQMPGTLTVAPFVIEADVEMKIIVQAPQRRREPPPPPPAGTSVPSYGTGSSNVRVHIDAWGHDDSDGSDVFWNSRYPRPSLDDDPRRSGKPNATWDGSYALRGDQLCLRIDNLHATYPPVHTLSIGYTVTLDGATFRDGSRTRTVRVMQFARTPRQTRAEVCEPISSGGTSALTTAPPYAGLPTSSKSQREIEKLFTARMSTLRTDAEIARLYDDVNALILVVGKHHFLLDPHTQQWHFWDRLHQTWEPTGLGAGDAKFREVRGKIVVKKRPGARRS